MFSFKNKTKQQKTTFKSSENTNVSAAILGPVVCIRDVLNKAGIYDKSMKYVISGPFLLFIGEEWTNVAVL